MYQMAHMMKKLNLELSTGSDQESTHSFCLLMDEISIATVKPAVEWILETNFAEQQPDLMNLIITSPGGDLNAAFSLIDVMRGSAIPIRTIGLGQIASAGLLIFIAGKKGQRILTPNTSILSHQYTWGSFGKEHELMAQVKEFDLITHRLMAHYKKCTGLKEDVIRKYLLPPQDVWLSSEEALDLKICDIVKDLK
jgi:ATP-dependent Clp protease protease subunit